MKMSAKGIHTCRLYTAGCVLLWRDRKGWFECDGVCRRGRAGGIKEEEFQKMKDESKRADHPCVCCVHVCATQLKRREEKTCAFLFSLSVGAWCTCICSRRMMMALHDIKYNKRKWGEEVGGVAAQRPVKWNRGGVRWDRQENNQNYSDGKYFLIIKELNSAWYMRRQNRIGDELERERKTISWLIKTMYISYV